MVTNTQIIHAITRAILACKHESQIEAVRERIDNSGLPIEQKKVLYDQCNYKEDNLPKEVVIHNNVPQYISLFSRQVGRKYVQYSS